MKIANVILSVALAASPLLPAGAVTKAELRAIIEAAYPGARITEIEREIYQGKKIYEIDFRHQGQALEAIISLDGELIRVVIDD